MLLQKCCPAQTRPPLPLPPEGGQRGRTRGKPCTHHRPTDGCTENATTDAGGADCPIRIEDI
eukprot:3058630-Lingulodinium_polyedra.AAC.1